jgi:RNA polymerase sigma-70 factor (ECF subfamily)
VFRFALYLSGNRSDAEDITSETFVRAWTSSARIRTNTVKGYLFTIARNFYLQGTRVTAEPSTTRGGGSCGAYRTSSRPSSGLYPRNTPCAITAGSIE